MAAREDTGSVEEMAALRYGVPADAHRTGERTRAAGQSRTTGASRARTVLICDDDYVATSALTRHLVAEGLQVRALGSTSESLASIARDPPGMVVIEPNLASQYWYRFLHGLTQNLDIASASVVIVTAYPSLAMREEAAALGIRALLTKPVSPHKVIDALRSRFTTFPFSSCTANSRMLASVEWEHINEIIRWCRGNMSAAARELGLPRQTLYAKLRKVPTAKLLGGGPEQGVVALEEPRSR